MSASTRLQRTFAVLVNYNSASLTLACLAKLGRAGLRSSQAIVVDNASTDDSARALVGAMQANGSNPVSDPLPVAEPLPVANLITAPYNLGFAGGCNLGAAAAFDRGAEAVLLINADTAFEPDLLDRLIPTSALSYACRSPEIYRLDAPGRLWFGGAWRGRVPGRLRLRQAGDRRVDVDYLWACCLLIGREVWQTVGAFDTRFFLYFEDMEWCDRARRAGIRPSVVNGARMWHAIGATLGGPSTPQRRYHMTRSGVLYASTASEADPDGDPRQHPRRVALQARFLVRVAADTRIAAGLALRGDRSELRAHLAGWRDGLEHARRLREGNA